MPQSHSHSHSHAGGVGHRHVVGEAHSHDPSVPHPSQSPPWSILRMALSARLGAAALLSAGLWAMVLLAMRPA